MTYQWIETQARTATPIVEFRRYAMQPGRRDELIELFEERFIEPQEDVGAQVLGTFTVEGDADRFVWLRGFEHMPARRAALERFYGGPVWAANREAANATMVSSDDVLLLRAVAPESGLKLPLRRLAEPAVPAMRYLVLVSDLRFQEQIGSYHLWLRLFLRKAGMAPIASFATLEAENDYPALPVHRNRSEHVALLPFSGPVPELPPELRNMLRNTPEQLVLNPTRRSWLR
jgi:hypothetical protein